MTVWSKPSHKFATSTQEELPEDFKFGIDLSLGQLIETRNKPVIQWLAPDSRVKTNRVGGFRSRFKGRGMDFDEVRLYQIGDDIRNIDWKVTARTGEAHTKLFKEERERPVFVVLDQMPNMFFGTAEVFKSVVASKIAAQLMWNTLSNGDRFGALLFSQSNHVEMKPSSNRRNCMRLLNRIVENHQKILNLTFGEQKTVGKEDTSQVDSQFSQTLKRLKFLAKPGTLIHIVSDFNQFDESCQRHLSKLSQHADIHCIQISDPIERELPPDGLYGITDGTTNGFLNTQQKGMRENYRQAFENKIELVKDFALSHRGAFSQVDTNFKQQSVGQHQTNSGRALNEKMDASGNNNMSGGRR
ncbi:DUF58 domain-containing protein [Aliikangiella coralliicola]|uniref:DUF58 domain-containing protein n=1 Tax=Aliikangiella coralliicola TaxID=2592383 RepID=A0A545TST2_9GAMM|nr:DUF58 domain-containing protein [Aliikangiella coralliicola]TQV80279.1 DUF58 domain-containing protein [Aliikangiella coralliicola]